MKKADLRQAHIRTLERAWIHLRAIELDLQVLRSEFSPDLHEINAEVHELLQKMKHYPLRDEGDQDGQPHQDAAPVPADDRKPQNGGQEPSGHPQDQTIKHHD